jgi:transposase
LTGPDRRRSPAAKWEAGPHAPAASKSGRDPVDFPDKRHTSAGCRKIHRYTPPRHASNALDVVLDQATQPKVFRLRFTESGGPRGYDAGKKVNGRKRPIITDTNGLLVGAQVHGADIQDRDGAVGVLASIRNLFPWLRHVFADGGYAGEKRATRLAGMGQWTLAIVKRPDQARGFCRLPRRWVVERTVAWLGRNRRLAKDFEATIGSAEAWLYPVQLLARRRHGPNTTNR